MKQKLEEKKEQLKAELCEEIEKYYVELCEGLENETIKIDDIERMLGGTQTKLQEMVKEATGEAVTETEPPTEKNDVRVVNR